MWLEKFIYFVTQKKKAIICFEKVFYKLFNNAFYGETMENIRITLIVKSFEKDDSEKIREQQSKIKFQWKS